MVITANTITSLKIKEIATELGFDLCGIAAARALDEHRDRLINWTNSGMHSDMNYLAVNIEKRIDPRILFPGAKSIIVTGLNYYSDKKQGGNGVPVISKYAYGHNYHVVIKSKLNKILASIREIHPEVSGKVFVDTAPILEKAWGREAGLGWPGKNSILINSQIGSFFFLGILILNISLEYDQPNTQDHCGECSMCIDSCPTGAINDNRTINTSKCIAWLTIEASTQVPDDLVAKLEGRAFGCDKCQDVCPWNNKARPNNVSEFALPEEVARMSVAEWKNLTRKEFKHLFKESAIIRRSYCRFMDNIEAATKF
jgi:epoxyqueuosine reductase